MTVIVWIDGRRRNVDCIAEPEPADEHVPVAHVLHKPSCCACSHGRSVIQTPVGRRAYATSSGCRTPPRWFFWALSIRQRLFAVSKMWCAGPSP